MPNRKKMPMLHIPPEEYEAFRAGLQKETSAIATILPATYSEWLNSSANTEALYKEAGLEVVRIPVRWRDFSDYADQARLLPTYSVLDSYTMYLHYLEPKT